MPSHVFQEPLDLKKYGLNFADHFDGRSEAWTLITGKEILIKLHMQL